LFCIKDLVDRALACSQFCPQKLCTRILTLTVKSGSTRQALVGQVAPGKNILQPAATGKSFPPARFDGSATLPVTDQGLKRESSCFITLLSTKSVQSQTFFATTSKMLNN
jgi:hypothetical protein